MTKSKKKSPSLKMLQFRVGIDTHHEIAKQAKLRGKLRASYMREVMEQTISAKSEK